MALVDGFMQLSEYPDVDTVEAALATEPSKWRTELVFWEYALVRASLRGDQPPTNFDHARIQRLAVMAHPFSIVFALTLCAAVAALIVWLATLPQPADGSPSVAIFLFIPLVAAALQLFQLRAPARALRLVWTSRYRSAEERRTLLVRAARMWA